MYKTTIALRRYGFNSPITQRRLLRRIGIG